MAKTAFIIGGATTDTIIEYEDMETMVHQRHGAEKSYLVLEEGKKIEVTAQKVFTGGGATNTSVSFQRQGYDVQLFCKIGPDAAGQFVLEEMQKFGINTDRVVTSDNIGTASSFIIPSLKGDRVVFAYRGANATLLTEDLPLADVAKADFLYITSLSRESAQRLPDIVKAAQQHKVPVAINPGVSQLKLGAGFLADALDGIDILMMNLKEAETLMLSLKHVKLKGRVKPATAENLLDISIKFEDSRFNLREFFDTVLHTGPRIVVVTNGDEGVYVATKEKIYYHAAAAIERIVNTLGAGDAFGSGFVGAIYQELDIPDAIRCGIVNSQSVIGHPDAKTGLLSRDEIRKQVKRLDKALCVEKQW